MPTELLVGQNRYERGKKLGDGRWGVVFLARCKISDTHFAVKRLKGQDFDANERKHGVNFSLLRELKCLREVKHENVINMVDTYFADGHLHMVLELCNGDLGDVS